MGVAAGLTGTQQPLSLMVPFSVLFQGGQAGFSTIPDQILGDAMTSEGRQCGEQMARVGTLPNNPLPLWDSYWKV